MLYKCKYYVFTLRGNKSWRHRGAHCPTALFMHLILAQAGDCTVDNIVVPPTRLTNDLLTLDLLTLGSAL